MSDAADLRVVRGNPSDEELAALVAVLAAAASGAPDEAARPRSAWADPARSVRETLPHGPGAWRASGLPR